jgi:hypothetical protein
MVLERNTAEVARAEEQYMEGAEGLPVQDDLDERVAEMEGSFTPVDNDELATELNSTDATVAGGTFPVYTGGNVVNEESPHPTVMDGLVRDALDAGEIFHTGGQIPPTDFEDASSLAPYLDPMWLVEAAKKTAVKGY